MEQLRVISYEVGTPSHNMALDEAIARSVGSGRCGPTLRLYGWSPEAVSIGYFQEAKEEIDLDFCRLHGLVPVRRITGGGAVIHSRGELTYSFAIGSGDPRIPEDIQESYRAICQPVVDSLNRLEVKASFKPINDIEVSGRKVSGSAQTRRFGAVLQHGTILLDLDYGLMGALKVKPEKLKSRSLHNAGERVTTLKEVLGRQVGHLEMANILVEEFARHFQFSVVSGSESPQEQKEATALEEKYLSSSWLLMR